jgi:hypothetical protein
MTTYAVSKWAVRALGRQLAVDNRDLPDVHVSVVSPGGVDTPIYESAANYLGVPGRPPPPVTTPERVARAVLRVLDRPRDRRQVGLANGLMRAGFTLMPRLYDALVGPLFAIAALDRTREIPAGPGSVLSPAQPVGRAPGSRRLLPSTTRMTRSVSGVGGLVRAPPGYGQHMWLLAVLILVALVICCMPLPSQPRHRSDRPARAQRGQGLGGRTT